MTERRHEIEGGWILVERDVDLRGRVLIYALEGTPFELVRTPTGWRARLAAKGNARRAYIGGGCESAPQVVRYLLRFGRLRGMSPEGTTGDA